MSAKRARSFKETRKHHLLEAAEDYTELILDLTEAKGEARTCDIAEALGISHVTALRTMKRLQSEGFLVTAPHKPVTLTEKGKETATFSKERHNVLLEFFNAIGVPKATAEIDVEGMEHHVSSTTLKVIKRFLKNNN